MIDRLTRLYTILINPLLTPLYVAAILLFCPTTFSALIPLPYRLTVFSSLAIVVSLLPLTVETYLRIKCKIPRGEQLSSRHRRWLCVSYAFALLLALIALRPVALFSLVVPLMKGVAALWIITAASMTLRRETCREMIFAGGMTAFLAILALAGSELWTTILCGALLAAGLAATALSHLGRSSLAGTGIDSLLGAGTMLAALYFI